MNINKINNKTVSHVLTNYYSTISTISTINTFKILINTI